MAYNLNTTFKDVLKIISLGVMASISSTSGDVFSMEDESGWKLYSSAPLHQITPGKVNPSLYHISLTQEYDHPRIGTWVPSINFSEVPVKVWSDEEFFSKRGFDFECEISHHVELASVEMLGVARLTNWKAWGQGDKNWIRDSIIPEVKRKVKAKNIGHSFHVASRIDEIVDGIFEFFGI